MNADTTDRERGNTRNLTSPQEIKSYFLEAIFLKINSNGLKLQILYLYV